MAHGPVQYFVIAFPGNQFKGEIVPALADVVSKGLIRIVDISFVMKDAEGNVATMEINDLPEHVTSAYGDVIHAQEGLLSLDDIEQLAADIPPNNSAALLVFEHAWAANLAASIRNASGEVVAQGFVPHDVVEEILAKGAFAN